MKSIRIKNPRNLRDTGYVEIAPITILVGRNNSGKSTFLRSFPLLKQSIIRNSDGPLLWFEDDNGFIDFGSFADAVRFDEDRISFSFVFDMESRFAEMKEELRYTITIMHVDKDYVSEVTLEKNMGDKFALLLQLNYDYDGSIAAKIGNDCFKMDPKKIRDRYFVKRMVYSPFTSIFGYILPDPWILIGSFEDQAGDLSDLPNPKTLARIGACLFNGIALEEYSIYLQEIMSNKTAQEQTWIKNMCIGLYYLDLLKDADQKLNETLRNVHYKSPIRATAARYYRNRNIAVEEVDYRGENLAMYLNNLSKEKLHEFQEWTAAHFGFRIHVHGKGGHLSLTSTIGERKRQINLADVGFGISQILPILVELWSLLVKPDSAIFLIEQPELHLHPALQGKLVQVITEIVMTAGNKLSIVMETHSKTFIEELGMEIDEKRLDKEKVKVVLFESEENDSKVTVTSFDEFGYLERWPLVFLDAEF